MHVTLKQGISVCLSVHPRHIWRTAHSIFFTLGRCVVEDERKCIVQLGAIWTFDTFNINTLRISSKRCPQTLRFSVHPENVKEPRVLLSQARAVFVSRKNRVNRHFFGYSHVVCMSFQPDPFFCVIRGCFIDRQFYH